MSLGLEGKVRQMDTHKPFLPNTLVEISGLHPRMGTGKEHNQPVWDEDGNTKSVLSLSFFNYQQHGKSRSWKLHHNI